MTVAARLHDKAVIAERLARDRAVHLYEIGDLDDFFFPACAYYADRSGDAIALVYDGSDPPTLVALAREATNELTELVLAIADELPPKIYAHLAVGMLPALEGRFTFGRAERHAKLATAVPADGAPGRWRSNELGVSRCEPVRPSDLDELMALYRASYPETWFVPRMLETGAYYGVKEAGEWIAVAGVHVLSRRYRVAVLGNVVTRTDRRGRGLGRATCAAVMRALDRDVDVIGLNVAADNAPALRCYASLGFEPVSEYDEVMLHKR